MTATTILLSYKIKLSAVDFWHRECNEDALRLEHKTRIYPPKVSVNFIPLRNHHEFCTVQVAVTGYISDNNLDSEINLPLGELVQIFKVAT